MNHFSVKVLGRLGLLRKLNVTVTATINQKKVIIPFLNGLGADNLAISELWMCTLLQKILPLKKGVFIDVGVNVGQTLIKLRTVDSDIDYIGFEPNPLCVYYAGELIKENHYRNTRLLPVGLFNEDGVLQLNLYSDGDTDQAASVIENFRPNEKVHRRIFVPVSRFENISKTLNIDDISIIKIDVEGAELEVLQSLENTLLNKRPFVFVEILPAYSADNSARVSRQIQLEAMLVRINYSIFRVIKKDKHTVQALQPLDNIGIHGDLTMCEYVLAPAELKHTITTLF